MSAQRKLNPTARRQLRAAGLTPAQWIAQHYAGTEWGGDVCGCPDDRCVGFHHDDPDDCECLPALLDLRAVGKAGAK